VIEQLERLNRLKEEGALTESEFEAQKARVLSGQDL
jgi:Short C-terminal domain